MSERRKNAIIVRILFLFGEELPSKVEMPNP
jgi:hypothetical protein